MKKSKSEEMKQVKRGHVALFFGKHVVAGECRFTAIKTQKKGGDAIFSITLIKPL